MLALTIQQAWAATTTTFNGGGVSGCPLSSKVYTCSRLPYDVDGDAVVIADTYTVNVNDVVSVGANQVLRMSGSAVLRSSGGMYLNDVPGPNLQISGGSLIAGGVFNMGAVNQTITANITATAMYLGTGATVTINGTLNSSGEVKIADNVTITGNVSGTYIRLATDSARVNGNVTASGELVLESTASIVGNISATTLTMLGSDSQISGTAIVTKAVLGWHTRVSGTITCRNGTFPGQCDCVTNNSGYTVGTSPGPVCDGPAPAGPHHILIEHDGNAITCAPQGVTLKACANAACTSLYTGGATVTVTPGGGTVTIGSTGTRDANVAQTTAGTVSLSAGTGTTCFNASNGTASCAMTFYDTGFVVSGPDFKSGDTTSLTLKAVKSGSPNTSCKPAFNKETKNLKFSCAFIDPAGSSAVLTLKNAAGTQASCSGAGATLPVAFDDNGLAQLTLGSVDVGKFTVKADLAAPIATGTGTLIAVPAAFTVAYVAPAVTPTPTAIVAGEQFTIRVTARNTLGNATPNFGQEFWSEPVKLVVTPCTPSLAASGSLVATFGAFSGGMGTASVTWSEVGTADITAQLEDDSYFGAEVYPKPTGRTNSGAAPCKNAAGAAVAGAVGPFVPHHFDVIMKSGPGFTYSGQPLGISAITALSKFNTRTLNYRDNHARDVLLEALGPAAVANPGPGALKASASAAAGAVTVPAGAFLNGQASNLSPVYTFTNKLTAPVQLILRASDSSGASSKNGADGAALIYSGRLRLFGAFGQGGVKLAVPYRAEYYTGASWILNSLDTVPFGVNAVALSLPSTISAVSVQSVTPAAGGGQGHIVLVPGSGLGTVGVAVNLGSASADASCLATHPPSVGAAMPWLRSANGSCASGAQADPSARATIGVIVPEHRRVIHAREVFR